MQLEFIEIPNEQLLQVSQTIGNTGKLTCTDQFVYLDISNEFIYQLFPLMQEDQANKPDYFSEHKSSGAHISIVYPGELISFEQLSTAGERFEFEIQAFGKINFNHKTYFVLQVDCLSLTQIRNQLGLYSLPIYKGFAIPCYHITIATKSILSG